MMESIAHSETCQEVLAALQAVMIVAQPLFDAAPIESATEHVGKQARLALDNAQKFMMSAAIGASTLEQNAPSGMDLPKDGDDHQTSPNQQGLR